MLIISIEYSYSCNEQVCASMVSKCMLTQSCKCDLKNCSCCKECYNCLSYLYSECCSCVGKYSPEWWFVIDRIGERITLTCLLQRTDMCPKPNETRNALSKKSHVEELEGIPGLFKALTDEADEEEKWSIFTFPVDFDAALYGAKMDKEFKYYLSEYNSVGLWASSFFFCHGMHKCMTPTCHFTCVFADSADQELDTVSKERENIITYNCTVVYMSQCLSWNKCKQNCESMGATSYRYAYALC